jgi:DNA-binding transcriptional LysR family regulator
MDHVNVTKAVGLFDHAHDHVHVELHTIAVRPRIDALKTGRLDIGFVRPPVNDAALTGEVLLREPFVAAPPSVTGSSRKSRCAVRPRRRAVRSAAATSRSRVP